MIGRVLEHNRLNGYRFVSIEFGIIALVALLLAVAYGATGRWLTAAVAAGIALNGVVIVAFAIRSLLRGEASIGILKIYRDKTTRAQVTASNPRLATDTVLIAAAVLVPLALSILLARELSQRHAGTLP